MSAAAAAVRQTRSGETARSHTERQEAGKAIRDRLPRSQHGVWKKPAGRVDPIEILRGSDAERLPELVPSRYGRMLQSPVAFYRGSAAIMAADQTKTPATGLRVQACGDCHLMNFGGFATPERDIILDINDFDETLPAPWEWDVKRLATSFALAAPSLGLSDAKGRSAAETCARAYRKRLRELAEMHPLEDWYARLTWDDVMRTLPADRQKRAETRMNEAPKRSGSEMDFPKLAQVVGGKPTIRDTPPLIFYPEAARAPDMKETLERVLANYRDTLADDRRTLLDRYKVVDAAIKVVGIGSVGRRCWILLLMSASNKPLFLQFKEAVASVLEPYAGASAYGHHGQRVVMGQRMMQPASDLFLGWVTGPSGVQFYVRPLRDAKIKPLIETSGSEVLHLYAKACGNVLARAHANSGGVSEIAGYLGSDDEFDEAMGSFAFTYADQAERDHAALKAAVRKGKVQAYRKA